jgi:tetratricopeptide (TPR) repeat protein
LRRRRQELGWSLRQVEARAAELGVELPAETLMRIEQGNRDPGVRRLFTLIHVYNAELLSDALELGALAGGRWPKGDLQELTDRGHRAWVAGDISQALAHALAIREHQAQDAEAQALKQQALVSFATYARNLGKYRLARQLVDDLLRQPLAGPLLVQVLVLAASIWWGLGALEAALALIERAIKRVDPADLTRVALVEHQWAKLLLKAGQPLEAERHLDRALDLWRRTDKPHNEVRALVLRVDVEQALDRGDAALSSAREAVALAEERDFGMLASRARLDLGYFLLERGEHEAALEELRRGLASSQMLGDRRAQFYAHARLWKAYAAMAEPAAAAIELRHAATLAESVDEHAAEVEEVRSAAGMPARPVKPARRSRAAAPRGGAVN